ncbi:MAG TPA: class I SAM-dependent methyltransferase [Pyrinomonadaceae bacterium]|jgi:SAM-dependent methyltransferase|nr:class I SAM-dependent methyltransferase [Pyrinomonadaceae bacterium]
MSSTGLKFAEPRRVESLDECFFYHTIELPGFGLVRGQWDLRGRFEEYVGGVEVAGKSVLDVGAATGFLSFEAERLGASRVVSFDMSDVRQQTLLPFKDKLYFQDHERWAELYGAEMERWKDAYWLSHRLLGSRAEVFYGSVYEVPEALGQFDVVIVGSVLEHLNDQISALASISRVAKETIVVVTPLLQTEERIARFEPLASNPDYDFTWWTYSAGVYREVFAMLGFRVERVTSGKYFYDYGGTFEERFTIVAARESE